MPSFYWIKLYHEILDDPKMGRLSDTLWRCAIECFLLAGEEDAGGFLPDIEDIAWRLRGDPAQLKEQFEQLAEAGILEIRDDLWFVTNFEKRQARVPDAERQALSRDRKRKAEYYGRDESVTGDDHEDITSRDEDVTGDGHEGVTSRDTDIDIDIDTDPEEDKDAESPKNGDGRSPSTFSTFQEWQNRIQTANNRPAVLCEMFEALYSGSDPPNYGYLGKTARDVGGAGRLAELLWQYSTKPPTGDVLAYLLKVAKNNGSGGSKKQGAGYQDDGQAYLVGKNVDFVKH